MPRSSRIRPSSESGARLRSAPRRPAAAARRARRRLRRRALRPEVDDLLPGAHQRVREDQQQVAGPAHAQRRVDRLLLVRDHRDRRLRHARGEQRRRHDARHFVGPAVAQVVVAPADVVVEAARRRRCAIARRSSSRRSPGPASTTMRRPGDVEPAREVGEHADRVRVVAVVEEHLERMLVVDVHAARRLEERRVEGAQALADRVELDAERERHRGGEHRVLHVVRRAALERRRDQVRPHAAGCGCRGRRA